MPARVVAKLPPLPVAAACALWLIAASAAAADDAGLELYEKKLRPALLEHCVKCHGPDKQEGGLQVDSVAAILRGGDQGPAVVPGDPDASLLIQGLRYDDVNFQMPPKGKLSGDVVAAFEQWVRLGAPAPASEQKSSSASAIKTFDLAERAKHWCFQPLKSPPPPEVGDAAWPRGAVDRFVLHKLEQARLRPAPQAEPNELIRRLSYDLTGLPPTVVETDEFVAAYLGAADDSAREAAYGALVDRLLASPRFGERWARHWLDLVRYAESRGHEFDYAIPNAYQYRDYVIRAFNADVPYDRFVVEHLAGDLLPEPRRHPQTGGNESILGTGFWFLGEECHSPVDVRQDETDRVDNKIDVMSKTFLGLTLACARCHDHKFDALSTKDYYAMSGFVLGLSYRQAAFETDAHNRRIFESVTKLQRSHRGELLQAQGATMLSGLKDAAAYAAAARSIRLDDFENAARRKVVETSAAKQKLELSRLRAWVAVLEEARADRLHPLHEWLAPTTNPSAAAADVLPPLDAASPQVKVDFATLKTADWLSDGVAFGDGPVRPGDLRIGDDPTRPVERLFAYSAAAAVPRWSKFDAVGDTGGAIGRLNWAQSARTVKTPTFTLGRGKLWYLVRGSGQAYAAVASHRMNNGPLHGNLIKHWEGPDRLRWIDHDLSAYSGMRTHLEFTPYAEGGVADDHTTELEVLCVVESDTEPRDVAPWHPATTLDVPRGDADSLARRLLQAARRIAADELTGDVRLEAWLVEHSELWHDDESTVDPRIASLFKSQNELLAQWQSSGPTAPAAWEGSAVDEYVLIRGNHRTVGDLVPRRFLEAIDGETPPVYGAAGGRLALAERLVDRSDPLPARVMVNRLWQHMFGTGLVRTVDNFGSMGEAPTHPELLDHLAQQFMGDGWSVKRMLRTLAISQAYRMSSKRRSALAGDAADASVVDPENKLLHRANVKRLEAEIVRDAMLAVSGRLDRTLYGPSVETYITPFMEGRGKPESGPLDGLGRRSIYLRVRRNFLNPMFQAFDYPTPFTSVGRRSVSNVPQQALSLMNGPLPAEAARYWAENSLAGVAASRDNRLDHLYREAFARGPTSDERAAAVEFLEEQRKLYQAASSDDPRVWADLCQVLFNTKEFIFIP